MVSFCRIITNITAVVSCATSFILDCWSNLWVHVNPAGLKSVIRDNWCKAGETEKLRVKGAVQFPDVSVLFPAPIALHCISKPALPITSTLDQWGSTIQS